MTRCSAHSGCARRAGRLAQARLVGQCVRGIADLLLAADRSEHVTLFLGETTSMEFLRLPTICFLSGVICFLLALLCFLAETLLATRVLRFGRPR